MIKYLYLLNRESLMNHRGNILELKNKIYRFEMLQIIYVNKYLIFIKILYYINRYNNIIKKNDEIKKKLIHIIVNFILNYKSQNLKKIINNKIIMKFKYFLSFALQRFD